MGHYCGQRHALMMLGMIGLAICYIIRISPGVIILSMIDHQLDPRLLRNQSLSPVGGIAGVMAKKFHWTPIEQNAALSSFFYSYLAMQLPAAYIAQSFGGKWTFAFGICGCSILSLLLPSVVDFGGLPAFITIRVLQGFCQGLCYPSIHRLAGKWFPPLEYARLSGLLHSGYIVGTAIAMLCSGYLVQTGGLGGWPLPFYVWGSLGFAWLPVWVFCIAESPTVHPRIKVEEKVYIEESLHTIRHHEHRGNIPWRKLMTSSQVWLVMACYVMDGYANYTLLVCVPQYMEQILQLDLSDNGALSSLPYIVATGFTLLLSPLGDLVITRGCLSVRNARKFWSSVAAFGKAAILLTIAYLGETQRTIIIILLVTNAALSTATLLGFNLADLDLAPPYAGVLFAIFNCCSTFSGIVAPLAVGAFTSAYPAAAAWRYVFLVASAISFYCGITYLLFGRAQRLSWIVEVELEDNPLLPTTQHSIIDSPNSSRLRASSVQ